MKRVKVLHLHTLPVVSGSGINTYLTMKGTPKDRFEVSLACAPHGRLNDIVREAGMEVHEIQSLVQPLHPWKDPRSLFAMIRIIKKQKIDIVHTHNSKAGFLGRLAGRMAGVAVVVHTVHGFAFHDAEASWRRALFRRLEKMAASWADHTIFISQPMIDWADKEGLLQPGRYSKIFSGIDLEAFRRYPGKELQKTRKELGLQEGERVIGFVSKLWEGKGHETALRAMASVVKEEPSAKLLLVGEGPLEEKLRDLSHGLGIESSVIFAGFRTRIAEITSVCEFCILPSFFEGMGRVLLEAGACGKAVVASNVGGIPDIVVDGVTGVLLPPGDPKVLGDAMLRLIQNPALAQEMGQAAAARITQRFDARTMVTEIVALYEACLEQKGETSLEGTSARIIQKPMQKRKAG